MIPITPPTQDEWADALVDAWNAYGSVMGAMLRSLHLPGGTDMQMSDGDWESFIALFADVRPSVAPRTKLRQGVRSWLPTHARYASDALWDGRPDQARKLFTKGGKMSRNPADLAMIRKEEKAETRVPIGFRARDKRTDWKTVK